MWINLEYLSAEPYAQRCHALASPVQSGPAAGWTKWFYYPGFTESTGGLLREPGLIERQAGFDRSAWLATQGIAWTGEKLVSMFCYEPAALAGLLRQFTQHGLAGEPVRLLVAAGRAAGAVKSVFNNEISLNPNNHGLDQLSISYLPLLAQDEFDQLLWASDMNFVRGEDSVVRALWAGKPFVWQIYPQDDGAHQHKLNAFLDLLQAPRSLRTFHAVWNTHSTGAELPNVPAPDLPAWQACALGARAKLLSQNDLCSRLLGFVAKKR